MKVLWKDSIIAESETTQKVEGNHYFPPSDVNKELLQNSNTEYHCPWKGDAAYHHLVINGDKLEDAAWSYPEPKKAARNIAGYYAFDSRKVKVTD